MCLSVWKGPRLYYENVEITTDYLCISAYDTVKKFYTTALRDMLQRLAGVQFAIINS